MNAGTDHEEGALSEDHGPIRRASVVHHEPPEEHDAKPDHSALKIRRHSQSLREDYRPGASLMSPESEHAHVVFDKVDVLEFPETVGLDVVPTSGPPVALSMDEVGHAVATVDEFEAVQAQRQHRMILKMSKAERERKLREEGIKSEEFREVEHAAAEVREARKLSSHDPQSGLDFQILNAKDRLISRKKKKGKLSRLNPFRR